MFYLGLLLPICYIPGITGASIPTQWAVLSLALAFSLWRDAESPLHHLGLGFLAFATLGLFWAPSVYDGLFGLWIVLIWVLSFRLGLMVNAPADLYRGLALGLSISSALAIAQWFGYTPVEVFPNNIAGLFFNRTVLGAVTALVILGLISERLWLYIPALLPALLLSGSRGGWLILLVGLFARYTNLLIVLTFTVACAFSLSYIPDTHDALRMQIWAVTLKALTLFGYGPGSFLSLYYPDGSSIIHPEFVHNDYLQLWFEFGVLSFAPIAIFSFAVVWSRSPILYAFACLAAFYFPLYTPLTAFLGCFAAGHALRGFSLDRLLIRHCRPDLVPRLAPARPIARHNWREALPPFTRTAHPEA